MAAGEGDKFAEAPGVRGSCGVLACAGMTPAVWVLYALARSMR